MKTLESYRKNGSVFRLIIRSGDLAIFEGKSITGSAITYEVIHVLSHNGREIAGKWCEPAEYPPSNEQWGVKGFTCVTPDQARDRFEVEILKERQKPGTIEDVDQMGGEG